jgi:hypothetical protein
VRLDLDRDVVEELAQPDAGPVVVPARVPVRGLGVRKGLVDAGLTPSMDPFREFSLVATQPDVCYPGAATC